MASKPMWCCAISGGAAQRRSRASRGGSPTLWSIPRCATRQKAPMAASGGSAKIVTAGDQPAAERAAQRRDEAPAAPSALRVVWIAAALLAAALNLRLVLASLSPVLTEVIRDTGISSAEASILTTAPVLCLGIFGLAAPALALRYGVERVIAGLLLVLAMGTALRGIVSFPALLVGSILAGAGIGMVGALIPGVVKRDFPGHVGLMMGVYTTSLCVSAAARAIWALPAILAAAIWLPLLRRRDGDGLVNHEVRGLWRDPLAWQVTLYLGLQSSVAYLVFAWLVPILRDRGTDAASAGLVVSLSVMAQGVAALVTPSLIVRRHNQSTAAAATMALSLLGVLGWLYTPLDLMWLWAVVQGFGQGAAFAIGLTLVVLRSPDTLVANRLSSMSQSVGYAVASAGPLLLGILHDWTGDWRTAGPVFVAMAIAAAAFGILAGRAAHIRVIVRKR